MTPAEFHHAARLGLGRPILHLQTHPWQPHQSAIQDICLHNTAYDPQCEGSRADYAFQLVTLTDNPAHFASLTATALLDATDDWDTVHLFHLNRLFAQAGHADSRNALYEKFQQEDFAQQLIGADDLMALDGVNGLMFALKTIGKWFESHQNDNIDDALLREAQQTLGPEIISTIQTAALTDPDIHQYLQAAKRYEQRPIQPQPDFRNWTYPELRNRIFASQGNIPRFWPSGWGKRASEESIRLAAADLLVERDPPMLLAYLHIFSLRSFPLDCEPLLPLAHSENPEIARPALQAFRHVQNDSVRTLALHLLQEKIGEASDVIQLLIKNYGPDDHLLIESLLSDPTNEDLFHSIAHSAVKIFAANPQSHALQTLLQIYEHCRCSLCRQKAIKILIDRKFIPSTILQECQYDSYLPTRQAVSSYHE